jgi:hypothetical protein
VRSKMKVSALVLAIAVGLNGTGLAQQPIEPPKNPLMQTPDRKAIRARAEVTRRAVGEKSRVRVKMRRYKLELKGYITQIDEDSFQLQIGPDRLETDNAKERLVTIRYAEVEKVRGPRSRAANIGIKVGMAVAISALVVALVVLRADRCSRHNCW